MKIFKRKLNKSEDLSIEEIKSQYYEKGYDDGISDGDYDARIDIAKSLLKTKLAKNEIIKITGISPQVIKDLNS